MHWLPLVAMVIASALPFPHDPASRIVSATTSPSDLSSQDQSATSLSAAAALAAPSSPRHVDDNTMAVFLSPSRSDGKVYESHLVNTLNAPPTDEEMDAEAYANLYFKDEMPDLRPSPASPRTSLDLTRWRTEGGFVEDSDVRRLELDRLLEGGNAFLDTHPRVLLSSSASPPDSPPQLLLFEDGDWDSLAEGHGESADGQRAKELRREKRSHAFDGRWVQRSVCESENRWVTNKTAAVDTSGRRVSIIQEIQTQSGPIKQYFYETRCRQAEHPVGGRHEETGVEGASCLGVDKKQWRSKCIAKQSYVRALTKDSNNRVGWRWIRIDSSCVCVLMSRTNSRGQSRDVVPGRGRG